MQFYDQSPSDFFVNEDHLNARAKRRLQILADDSKDAIICLRCVALIKQKATRLSTNPAAAPGAPRKARSGKVVISANLLRELRRTSAFYAQVIIFDEYENEGNEAKFTAIETEFFGDGQKRRGTLNQLLDGFGPFSSLYEVKETNETISRVLRHTLCGKDTKRFFEAGVDFGVKMLSLSTYSQPNSKLQGRTLWNNADEVLKNCKKAIALIPKLSGKLVDVDQNFKVRGYVSGHNDAQFFQYILDGMFYTENREENDKLREKALTAKSVASSSSSSRAGSRVPPPIAIDRTGSDESGTSAAENARAKTSGTGKKTTGTDTSRAGNDFSGTDTSVTDNDDDEGGASAVENARAKTSDPGNETAGTDTSGTEIDFSGSDTSTTGNDDVAAAEDRTAEERASADAVAPVDADCSGSLFSSDNEEVDAPTVKIGYLGCNDLDWDPWDGVRAPQGWQFPGYLAFVMLGPTTDYFSLLLKRGGDDDESMTDKHAGGRVAQRKKKRLREQSERLTGGPSRGMSIETKVHIAAVAQAEDEANTRQLERNLASITQEIVSYRTMMEIKMQLLPHMEGAMKHALLNEVNVLMKKVENLAGELAKLRKAQRQENVIVSTVLGHAVETMGVPRNATTSAANTGQDN